MMMQKKLTTIVILACLSVACGRVSKPDLHALYKIEERQAMDMAGERAQPPVIIIPGIVSTKLMDEQGKNVWFGAWHKILFSDYEELVLDIDKSTLTPKPSAIVAGELPRKVLGFDFYGSLFDVLEDYGDYQYTALGTPYNGSGRRYYKFPYDWRYGSVDTARKLDDFIEQVRKDYQTPDLEVDLVAHSMGGLIARYYMRYGTADVLDDNDFLVTQAGAKKVRRFVQLGAPNLGSIAALHQLIEGYKVIKGTVPVEVITTMPAVYQLLPHPLNDWLITTKGEKLDRDLFDVKTWQRFQWGIFNPKVIERIQDQYTDPAEGLARVELLQRYFHKHIERARRFVWSLSVPVPALEYSIVAFGGNCEATPARLLVEEVKGVSEVRLWPKDIKNKVDGVNYERLMLEPGDGRVTKPSMLAKDFLDPTRARHKYSFFPLDYAFFLCHGHGQLTGNVNFQDNLLNVLLERSHEEMHKEMGM